MAQLVLIYGLSGSGKSTAARILEDIGFRVLRNLPAFLIQESLEDARQRDDGKTRVAVFPELCGEEDVKSLIAVLGDSAQWDAKVSEIFLDASNETLLNRYKESRRPHPARGGIGILDSICLERSLLAPLHRRAHHVIETDNLRIAQLTDGLTEYLGSYAKRQLAVTFLSFGFKYGVPPEIDLCLDVRFLPNPYFVPQLRDLTGLDDAVEQFVLEKSETVAFMQKFEDFFDFLYPLYEREGKNYLTVGIGCTGGRHRSVAITNTLWKRCRKETLNVMCLHRDVRRSV
jgi:UPF0042 nucleotide-binding protein